MKAKELLSIIRSALITSREKSENPFISLDALIKYLDDLEKYTNEKEEYNERMHQRDLVILENQNNADVEMFRSVIDAGKDALRAIIIACGGAVVSLLALLGSLEKELLIKFGSDLTSALGMFSTGVLLAVIVYGARYLSQAYYSKHKEKIGNFFLGMSIMFVVLAYGLFSFGLYKTYMAFSGL